MLTNVLQKTVGMCLLVALFAGVASCKKSPLFANEGATLIIVSNKAYLKSGGETAHITVMGFDGDGQALHNHTQVLFSASCGTIDAQVELMGGSGAVNFVSGSSSGTAKITARSGEIKSDELEIVIGAAALDSMTIHANPASLPKGGGRSTVSVYAFDAEGNLLAGIPVILSTTKGTFVNGGGLKTTDSQGCVSDVVQLTETATVSAACAGVSDSVEIDVTETPDNEVPTAAFSYSPTAPNVNEKVYFNGSLSEDSDGTITDYKWDFGDGTTGSGQKPSHAYSEENTYTVVLTVTDNDGARASCESTIAIETPNETPTADFSYSPTTPKVGEPIYFNGGLSEDSDGTIISYKWDFGDGVVATGENPSHTYTEAKTYIVILKVTDNNGATDTSEQSIKVTD
jgi:PKD repeat protein